MGDRQCKFLIVSLASAKHNLVCDIPGSVGLSFVAGQSRKHLKSACGAACASGVGPSVCLIRESQLGPDFRLYFAVRPVPRGQHTLRQHGGCTRPHEGTTAELRIGQSKQVRAEAAGSAKGQTMSEQHSTSWASGWAGEVWSGLQH